MIIYRGRTSEIVFEFVPPEGEQKGIAVLCDGIPSVPKQKELLAYLSRKGLFVVFPRYRGAWESGGSFLANPPGNDIEEVMELLSRRSITELYATKEIPLSETPIYLIGSSFGGAVALSLVHNPKISKILAFSPLITFATELYQLEHFMRVGFGEGYRFTNENWKRMASGKLFSPPTKINAGRRESVFVVYDSSDTTIDVQTIETYVKENNIAVMKTNGIGHLSFSKIPQETWESALKWLLTRVTG